MLTLNQFDPIEETVLPLGEYFFHFKTKAEIKRRSKHRKTKVLEESSQQPIVWNAIGRLHNEVAQETVSSLGAFASVNIWSRNELIVELEKKKTQVVELEENLTSDKSVLEEEYHIKTTQLKEQFVLQQTKAEGKYKQGIDNLKQKKELVTKGEDYKRNLEASSINFQQQTSKLQ
jgi:hypothetical protein